MAPPLLTLKDIHLTFGGHSLLDGTDLTVAPGDRICLVGRNGSGKSTMLKIAAGLVDPDNGERFQHPGALVRYLPQEPDFDGYETALAYVEAGLTPLQNPYAAHALMSELDIPEDQDPATMSGGEARRLALARVIASGADVVLLDEPTNHLDLPAIEWLESTLKSMRCALVLISHDRRFLDTLSRTTVWIDRGVARRVDQSFSEFEDWRDKTLEEEAAQRHKLDRKIVREEAWMYDGGVTARRKRNVRRVRELSDLRKSVRDQRHVQGNVRMAAASSGQSSRLIVEAEGISKSYGERPIIVDFTTRILRGDRIGIVGPNGAGKTTLLRLLTGSLAPDSGTIKLGENMELVTLDQRRDELNPDWTLAQALTGGRGDQVVINGKARHVQSYMKDFLFTSEQARSPLRVLSGGERGRLMLARALAKPSNVLVLDEPTNDLDLETLDLLQEMLADYAGTVILISHDRDFLDRCVTSVIATEGDGRWGEYAGGYTDMLAQRRGADLALSEAKATQSASSSSSLSSGSAAAKSSASPPAQRRKLSFKEKHALETMPGEMSALQTEIFKLQTKLADAGFYSRDPKGFSEATSKLGDVQIKLAKLEDRWLELELMRDEAAV
jgi:ABC transport system ATP-binding/permease protein